MSKGKKKRTSAAVNEKGHEHKEHEEREEREDTVDGIPENDLRETGTILTGSRHLIHCLTIIGQIDCLTYGEGGLRGCGG